MALGREEIENRFGHHAASLESPVKPHDHAALRRDFVAFAEHLDRRLPDGRAKSVAFTQLEDASMWAHKALAALNPLEKLKEGHRDLPPPGVNV